MVQGIVNQKRQLRRAQMRQIRKSAHSSLRLTTEERKIACNGCCYRTRQEKEMHHNTQ